MPYSGTWEEARALVVSLNLQRRNLTDAEKALAGAKLANLKHGSNRFEAKVDSAIAPSTSQREAASAVGVPFQAVKNASVIVNHGTPELVEAVQRERVPLSTGAEIARAVPEVQPVLVAAGVTAQEARRIAQDAPEVQRAILASSEPVEAVREAARPHVANNSGNNEWYTPPDYIDRARAAMGGIDLDPASCDVAQRTVKATKHYTVNDDGLSLPWFGRVWMNPPYSSDLIGKFCSRLVESYQSGDVTAACVLVNNATDTAWFALLSQCASAVCFPRGRVRFLDASGRPIGAPLQGQAVVYLGKDPAGFAGAFHGLGRVWR